MRLHGKNRNLINYGGTMGDKISKNNHSYHMKTLILEKVLLKNLM